MSNSISKTEIGKAFEYACAYALFEKYEAAAATSLADSRQMFTAKRAFFSLPDDKQQKYRKGARAAVKLLDRLEPKLSSPSSLMKIRLQADSKGMAGDVRDVVCARNSAWEIGLSCKHNHDAVKHSRLSDTIDFGRDWFGKACSQAYFDSARRIFTPLREIRYRSEAAGRPALWSEIEDKEGRCYVPILQAFMKELRRLDQQYPHEIPALLVRYLIGAQDFYKVIMEEDRSCTRVEAVNINGTLNQPEGNRRALIEVPRLRLPSKFYEIEFRSGSANTIHVVCDEGWNVSMRIHNASSKIEPSLKFDVRLMATPQSMLVHTEFWEQDE